MQREAIVLAEKDNAAARNAGIRLPWGDGYGVAGQDHGIHAGAHGGKAHGLALLQEIDQNISDLRALGM